MSLVSRTPGPVTRANRTARRASDATVERILAATRETLLAVGSAGLSTRAVAAAAGVHLSQIHYHFGSKQALMLALFEAQDAALRERQRALFDGPASVADKWRTACDYLEVDLESGYVRLLHELIAQALVDEDLAARIRSALLGWHQLITGLLKQALADEVLATLGVTPAILAALGGAAFLGAEVGILLGTPEALVPRRAGLRAIGDWLELLERRGTWPAPRPTGTEAP